MVRGELGVSRCWGWGPGGTGGDSHPLGVAGRSWGALQMLCWEVHVLPAVRLSVLSMFKLGWWGDGLLTGILPAPPLPSRCFPQLPGVGGGPEEMRAGKSPAGAGPGLGTATSSPPPPPSILPAHPGFGAPRSPQPPPRRTRCPNTSTHISPTRPLRQPLKSKPPGLFVAPQPRFGSFSSPLSPRSALSRPPRSATLRYQTISLEGRSWKPPEHHQQPLFHRPEPQGWRQPIPLVRPISLSDKSLPPPAPRR